MSQKSKNKTIYHAFRKHDKRLDKGSWLNSFHVQSHRSNITADGSQLRMHGSVSSVVV